MFSSVSSKAAITSTERTSERRGLAVHLSATATDLLHRDDTKSAGAEAAASASRTAVTASVSQTAATSVAVSRTAAAAAHHAAGPGAEGPVKTERHHVTTSRTGGKSRLDVITGNCAFQSENFLIVLC